VLGLSLIAILDVALTPSVTSECEMALKTREENVMTSEKGEGGERNKGKIKTKKIISIMFLFHLHHR
jgi:hypothetical protein